MTSFRLPAEAFVQQARARTKHQETDLTGGKLVAEVTCACGFEETIEEPEDGQSLFGTAGWVAARHEPVCPKNERTDITAATREADDETE